MSSSNGQPLTDQEIDQAVDHYYSHELGATNGRWWDRKPHCNSPTVEARMVATFWKSMRDHWAEIEALPSYAISGSKERFRAFSSRPTVVRFTVSSKGEVDIEIHSATPSGNPINFGGYPVSSDQPNEDDYIHGRFDFETGEGTIWTNWRVQRSETTS